MTTGIVPLPSLIRASAFDAANMRMRRESRAAWNEADADLAAETLDRLVRATYGRASDHNQPGYAFLRFQMAEGMERRGEFHLKSSLKEILSAIDAAMNGDQQAA